MAPMNLDIETQIRAFGGGKPFTFIYIFCIPYDSKAHGNGIELHLFYSIDLFHIPHYHTDPLPPLLKIYFENNHCTSAIVQGAGDPATGDTARLQGAVIWRLCYLPGLRCRLCTSRRALSFASLTLAREVGIMFLVQRGKPRKS